MTNPGPEDWVFVIAIPAAHFKDAVEAGHAAIVGADDKRYKAICKADKAIKTFLGRFKTPFGARIKPAVVIRHKDKMISGYDLAALRNIGALASVVNSRRERFLYSRSGGLAYSDAFDFCPINVRKDGRGLLVETVPESGFADLGRFRGQITQAYAFPEHNTVEGDKVLLAALLKLWRLKPRKKGDAALRRRVFRSLEVAYHAMAAPFEHLRQQTDFAFRLSLWVTALEVLAHPGPGLSGNQTHVEALVRSVPWRNKKLRRLVRGINDPKQKVPVPVRTNHRLYKTRHKTLHGDQILFRLAFANTSPRWNPLYVEAPILYRFVLLAVLARRGLFHFAPDDSKLKTLKQWGDWMPAMMDQDRYEEPLYTSEEELRARPASARSIVGQVPDEPVPAAAPAPPDAPLPADPAGP